MLSLDHLRMNMFKLFALGYHEGLQIKVHYHKRVYLVTIEPTGEEYLMRPWALRKRLAIQKKPIKLNTDVCATCGSITLGDICINKLCPTNQPGSVAATDSPSPPAPQG